MCCSAIMLPQHNMRNPWCLSLHRCPSCEIQQMVSRAATDSIAVGCTSNITVTLAVLPTPATLHPPMLMAISSGDKSCAGTHNTCMRWQMPLIPYFVAAMLCTPTYLCIAAHAVSGECLFTWFLVTWLCYAGCSHCVNCDAIYSMDGRRLTAAHAAPPQVPQSLHPSVAQPEQVNHAKLYHLCLCLETFKKKEANTSMVPATNCQLCLGPFGLSVVRATCSRQRQWGMGLVRNGTRPDGTRPGHLQKGACRPRHPQLDCRHRLPVL